MSEPNTLEYAAIEMEDATTPGTYVRFCGINTTGFNRTAQASDRYVADCANPAIPPNRRVKITGRSWTLTGSGWYNVDQEDIIDAAIGVKKNFRYVMLDDDGTTVVLTKGGAGYITAANMGTSQDNLGTIELTIESDGAWATITGS